MNAKKIMGAVLVALLAAALFIGAGAAADVTEKDDLGTVFAFQKTPYEGKWTGEKGTIVFVNGIIDTLPAEGYYSNETAQIYVAYPTATISAVAAYGNNVVSSVVGGTLYKSAEYVNITAASPANGTIKDLLITLPDGTEKLGSVLFNLSWSNAQAQFAGSKFTDGLFVVNLTNDNLSALKATGVYKIQAVFTAEDSEWNLTTSTPDKYLIGAPYTITVAKGESVSVSANVDSVIIGENVKITIEAQPGKQFYVEGTHFDIDSYGTVVNGKDNNGTFITIPNSGVAVIYVTAMAGGNGKVSVTEKKTTGDGQEASVSIKVTKGTITAETDKEAYYIGNPVTITGTSTAGSEVHFYIAGTNIEFRNLTDDSNSNDATVDDGAFEFGVLGTFFKNYDAGSYTVYVSSEDGAYAVEDLDTYTTVALVLKQPFISVTDAPSVAVKGTTYTVTGTAEAAVDVYAYIFGTNFFAASNKSAAVGALGTTNFVDLEDEVFTIEFSVPTGVADMATGQYFMVIQHPMYDKEFNIYPNGTDIRLENVKTNQIDTLFNVTDRQKANAAEALCQAIDSENIDDMYVKLSFVVAAAQSVINPIPETVAQGEKLTVSGSTNVGAGETVTVEMLSTAFAAVPKATVGSASFISLTTKTDENGNWEITFDTTGLNVDEYTVTAAVGQLGTATAKVNVVEAAPSDEPSDEPADEPSDEPQDEPTDAPETPGFGALAALAGLGAVAVLLLRRE